MKKNPEKHIINIQKRIVKKIMPKQFPKELQDDMLEYVDFRRALTTESDRGAALLAASHLDFLLEKMLKSKMVGTKKQLKQLFDFNGPLGTFSNRILMSFSLGIIPRTRLEDLQIIRKIRNDFGHSPSIISFENERIKSLCNGLNLTVNSNKTPKAKFITSVSFLSGGLAALYFKKEDYYEECKEIDIDLIKKENEKFRAELEVLIELEEE